MITVWRSKSGTLPRSISRAEVEAGDDDDAVEVRVGTSSRLILATEIEVEHNDDSVEVARREWRESRREKRGGEGGREEKAKLIHLEDLVWFW
jgi:hypothetical protein